jgi:hypothetical protein
MTEVTPLPEDRLDRLERQVAALKMSLQKSADTSGGITLRNPDIVAQQFRTRVRGHGPKYRPSFEPPANIVPPHVEGSGLVGEVLTSSTGDWTNADNYKFQWKKMESGQPIVLPGATTHTYTPTMQDNNKGVFCMVLATNAFGQAIADSNIVSVYAAEE